MVPVSGVPIPRVRNVLVKLSSRFLSNSWSGLPG